MKTCEGAGALTKEQGGIPNSTTFLYTTEKIVSIVESSKERERPEKDSVYPPKISSHDAFLLFGLLSQ